MPLDLTGRHSACIHADDLAVELGKTTLILGDQQRIKGAVAVARNVQDDFPTVGGHSLLTAAITAIGRMVLTLRDTFGAFFPKMFLHLSR